MFLRRHRRRYRAAAATTTEAAAITTSTEARKATNSTSIQSKKCEDNQEDRTAVCRLALDQLHRRPSDGIAFELASGKQTRSEKGPASRSGNEELMFIHSSCYEDTRLRFLPTPRVSIGKVRSEARAE